ncbi:MAG: DUF1501 domain-containing protein [Planctomycetaceae bacterium]|nr:DUF1501 domain-containing protein [Planctomycetaceae bacterium]
MLNVGRFSAGGCSGPTRRSFLKMGGSLPLLLGRPALAAPTPPARAARAKSVLLVWLWGAPSHLDTFDPKPDAPPEYRGPFSAIATRTPGVHVTDLLPRIASISDKFALVRSHVSSQSGHPDGGTVALTGFHEKPGPVQPNFGAIVARHRGRRGDLPPFQSVGRGIIQDSVRIVEGYGGGTFGKAWDPFQVVVSNDGSVNLPSLNLLDGITPNRISDRRLLLNRIDTARRQLDAAGIADWERSYQLAYGLLSNPKAREAFDVTRESQETRHRYGYTTFGQSALVARRLIEARVPYVQLNWSQTVEAITPAFDFGWDTHIYNFEMLMDRHCPILDRVLPELMGDLETRGLLEETLVVVISEFGRTPKINPRAARDHWPQCYFSLWSGAGVPTGVVIGRSDRLGEHPIDSPITPLMVGTTITELAGISTRERAEMNVLSGGRVIYDLL